MPVQSKLARSPHHRHERGRSIIVSEAIERGDTEAQYRRQYGPGLRA